MARSINTRSTARKSPVVPIDLNTFQTVIATAVQQALAQKASNDDTPSATILHDSESRGRIIVPDADRDIQPVATTPEPERTVSFTQRNVDITDPTQQFFSDVARKPKERVHKPRTEPTRDEGTAPTDPRVNDAVESLEKARQVLAYVNPDLGGKSRKWTVNNAARKRATEVSLQLVHDALRALTR